MQSKILKQQGLAGAGPNGSQPGGLKPGGLRQKGFKQNGLIRYALIAAILLTCAVFTVLEPKFCTPGNFLTIISQAAPMGIMAVGITFVMAIGEMDFAAGAEFTAGACTVALVLSQKGLHNYFLAFLAGLCVLVLFGLLNGIFHAVIGIPSFIATLGTSTFITGVFKLITKGTAVFSMRWPKSFTYFGQGFILGIPVSMIIFLLVVALAFLIMERLRLGRKFYAVGLNVNAARNVGIAVRRTKITAMVFCAVFCGIGGMLQSSMLNSANAFMGESLFMDGMSCVMLGATFWKIGVFNIPGTAVATLLLAVISNGLTMIGASSSVKDYFQGAILLISVGCIALIRKHLSGAGR